MGDVLSAAPASPQCAEWENTGDAFELGYNTALPFNAASQAGCAKEIDDAMLLKLVRECFPQAKAHLTITLWKMELA